jgi:hypothetical protein
MKGYVIFGRAAESELPQPGKDLAGSITAIHTTDATITNARPGPIWGGSLTQCSDRHWRNETTNTTTMAVAKITS